MTPDQEPRRSGEGPFIGAGALAGATSVLLFTIVHQVLISSIWFALPAMLAFGVVSGAALTWTYLLVVPHPTAPSWLRYNGLFLAMFVLLGVVSLVTFEPQTTIAALLRAKAPPRALIGHALPMTGLFLFATVLGLTLLYRPRRAGAFGLLVTTTLLVLGLGLNISILGLVDVPRAEAGVLAETGGLLATLTAVFAGAVLLLQRSRLPWRRS